MAELPFKILIQSEADLAGLQQATTAQQNFNEAVKQGGKVAEEATGSLSVQANATAKALEDVYQRVQLANHELAEGMQDPEEAVKRYLHTLKGLWTELSTIKPANDQEIKAVFDAMVQVERQIENTTGTIMRQAAAEEQAAARKKNALAEVRAAYSSIRGVITDVYSAVNLVNGAISTIANLTPASEEAFRKLKTAAGEFTSSAIEGIIGEGGLAGAFNQLATKIGGVEDALKQAKEPFAEWAEGAGKAEEASRKFTEQLRKQGDALKDDKSALSEANKGIDREIDARKKEVDRRLERDKAAIEAGPGDDEDKAKRVREAEDSAKQSRAALDKEASTQRVAAAQDQAAAEAKAVEAARRERDKQAERVRQFDEAQNWDKQIEALEKEKAAAEFKAKNSFFGAEEAGKQAVEADYKLDEAKAQRAKINVDPDFNAEAERKHLDDLKKQADDAERSALDAQKQADAVKADEGFKQEEADKDELNRKEVDRLKREGEQRRAAAKVQDDADKDQSKKAGDEVKQAADPTTKEAAKPPAAQPAQPSTTAPTSRETDSDEQRDSPASIAGRGRQVADDFEAAKRDLQDTLRQVETRAAEGFQQMAISMRFVEDRMIETTNGLGKMAQSIGDGFSRMQRAHLALSGQVGALSANVDKVDVLRRGAR